MSRPIKYLQKSTICHDQQQNIYKNGIFINNMSRPTTEYLQKWDLHQQYVTTNNRIFTKMGSSSTICHDQQQNIYKNVIFINNMSRPATEYLQKWDFHQQYVTTNNRIFTKMGFSSTICHGQQQNIYKNGIFINNMSQPTTEYLQKCDFHQQYVTTNNRIFTKMGFSSTICHYQQQKIYKNVPLPSKMNCYW